GTKGPPAMVPTLRAPYDGRRALVTCAVVAEIIAIAVAVVRRIAIAVGRIAIGVNGSGSVGVAVIRIGIIGSRKCASDNRAEGEAAERRGPPAASPAGISRGGRGNCCGCEGGGCGESDQRFPHDCHLEVERPLTHEGSRGQSFPLENTFRALEVRWGMWKISMKYRGTAKPRHREGRRGTVRIACAVDRASEGLQRPRPTHNRG